MIIEHSRVLLGFTGLAFAARFFYAAALIIFIAGLYWIRITCLIKSEGLLCVQFNNKCFKFTFSIIYFTKFIIIPLILLHLKLTIKQQLALDVQQYIGQQNICRNGQYQ
jgi:hypothetical protein